MMKILVFIKEVPDVRIPVEYSETTGVLKDVWNVTAMDPQSKLALGSALQLRDRVPDMKITAIYIAPPSGDGLLRDALAMGCDEALRVWDEELRDLHSQGKAVVFARVARILGFDLIITGTKSPDTASGQTGALLGAHLEIPTISDVKTFVVSGLFVKAVKQLDDGFEQHIEASLPVVVSVNAHNDNVPYPSFSDLYDAAGRKIPCWNLSDTGLAWSEISQAELLSFGPIAFPVPRSMYIAAPDSSLPGFERREHLRAGTMKKREGRMVATEEDVLVEELFQTLLSQGWLGHLKEHT
jgi:electron transfer flavoprotein beta subunit